MRPVPAPISVVLLVGCLIPAYLASAQAQPGGRGVRGVVKDVAQEVVNDRVNSLSASLDLGQDQKEQLQVVLSQHMLQLTSSIMTRNLSVAERQDRMLELMDGTRAKIGFLLTPEQQPKFDQMGMKDYENLSLTPAQTEKVRGLVVTESKQVRATFEDKALSARDRLAKLKQIHTETRTAIRAQLDRTQQPRFDALQNRLGQGMRPMWGGGGALLNLGI
jgi:hypothetical protein